MNEDLFRKLQVARTNVLIIDPFVGYVLQHFNITILKDFPTAATDGNQIIFGERFLSELTLQDTVFVLMHELLHIVLGHHSRARGKEPNRFNVACDIIVNDILLENGYLTESLPVISGRSFDIYSRDKTSEEVYDYLDGKVKPLSIIDSHPWFSSEENYSNAYDETFEVMKQARDMGQNPKLRGLRNRLNKILPSINWNDWKRILENYIEKAIFDYSYERMDPRYKEILMPQFVEFEDALKDVWFLIDVSGSVSDEELNIIVSEISRISDHFKSLDCSLSFFSTRTTAPTKLSGKKKLIEQINNEKTNGGTDFIQIFESMELFFKRNRPGLVIVFTDGHSIFPSTTQIKHAKVIWCVTTDITAPLGKTIHINQHWRKQ